MSWASDFIDLVLVHLLGDRPDEIVFLCQPESIEISSHVGGIWYPVLPVTREAASMKVGKRIRDVGGLFLDEFNKLPPSKLMQVSINGNEIPVSVQFELKGNQVRVCPNYGSSVH